MELIPQLALRPWVVGNGNHLERFEAAIPRRYHLHALNAFQLLSPDALGGASDYFGDDNNWETLFAIGLAPLFLGVIAILRHPDRKLIRGWLALVGLAVWVACGRHLGLFALMYHLVPGMSWFRVPARSLFLANLGWAVLVGLGIETLSIRIADARAWRRFAVSFAAVSLTVLLELCWVSRGFASNGPARMAEAAQRVLSDGCFWLTLCGLAGLLAMGCLDRATRNPRLATVLFGLLAVAELGWQGYAHLPVAPAERFTGVDPVGAAIRRLVGRSPRSGPVRIKARDSFYGDLPAVCSAIEKTNINDIFQLDHAARLYETLYSVASRPRRRFNQPMNQAVDDFQRQVRQTVFDRMSVSFLVSDRVESDPGWPVAAEGDWHGARFVIERNLTALPRAYVVPSAAVVPEDETFAHFRTDDPRSSVLMSDDPLRVVPAEPRQRFTAAAWRSTDPDQPVLEVSTDAPGLLVVTDTWLPGWSARVDDVETPIHRGNYAQRVIPIFRPGRHTIAMIYQPPGFALGRAITVLSSLGWVFVCGFMTSVRRADRARASAGLRTDHRPIRRWTASRRHVGASASMISARLPTATHSGWSPR